MEQQQNQQQQPAGGAAGRTQAAGPHPGLSGLEARWLPGSVEGKMINPNIRKK